MNKLDYFYRLDIKDQYMSKFGVDLFVMIFAIKFLLSYEYIWCENN